VVEIRVERIAAEFITAPFSGKDCPLVCVRIHPEDADMFNILHPERSRYIIVGHKNPVAGLKKALEFFTKESTKEEWGHLSFVECKLYKGLTDSQMKALGALHNLKQGKHNTMTGKELMKSFNRSSITHGMWAIRHSELDNPKSNKEQQALKKLCYQEAGLDDSKMTTHLYLWNLATKFQQMTFDLLIEVMEMYEKYDCKGQIKKPQAASKVVKKNVKKRRARFQLDLQDQKLTGSTTKQVEVHEPPPAMPHLSKMHLQFLAECCKHSESVVLQILSKVRVNT